MNISVVNYPSAHPGKCMHCGNASAQDGRKFVDLGHQVPRYGAVYFCEHCVKELGRLFGLVDRDSVQKLEIALASAEGLLFELREENVQLRNALSSLDMLGVSSTGGNPSDNAASQSQDDAGSKRNNEQDSSGKPSSKRGQSKADNGPAESDASAGSTDVSGDDLAAQLRTERRRRPTI